VVVAVIKKLNSTSLNDFTMTFTTTTTLGAIKTSTQLDAFLTANPGASVLLDTAGIAFAYLSHLVVIWLSTKVSGWLVGDSIHHGYHLSIETTDGTYIVTVTKECYKGKVTTLVSDLPSTFLVTNIKLGVNLEVSGIELLLEILQQISTPDK
jgi:hypothetical protein